MANGQVPSFEQFLQEEHKKTPVPAQVPKQKESQPASQGLVPSFSDFLKSEGKQATSPPGKWSEVPFLARPYYGFGSKELSSEEMAKNLHERFDINIDSKDPRVHQEWKNAWNQIDPLVHPYNFVMDAIHQGHRLVEEGAEKFFPTSEESAEEAVKLLQASANDPSVKNNPERKKMFEDMVGMARTHRDNLIRENASGMNYFEVIPRAEATTVYDWEAMGAIFKPMQWAERFAKASKAARTGLYVINQAIGADFSWNSIKQGIDLWKQGKHLEAWSEFGGAAGMLVLPLLGHWDNERKITQEQIRKKAYDLLEEKKKEVAAKQAQLPPDKVMLITPKAIEDMQYRIANGLPMMGIGRPEPRDIPMPDRDVLNLGEQNLHNKNLRENIRSEAQRRIGRLEEQQRAIDHQRRVAREQAKTDAEHRQLMAELDAREKTLKDEIKREKERFKTETTGLQRPVLGPTQLDTPPAPAKKPFEAEPLELSPGSRPMTREEREDEWVEERRKRYTDQLKEEREQRLRAGEEFKVEDRRRQFGDLTPPPGAPQPMGTPPSAETAPAATAAPLAPPPQTRGQIQDKIAAAAWENQELELRKAQAKTAEELVEIEQQQEKNRELAGDLAVDRIAEAMEGRKKPQEFKAGEKLSGPTGKSSELKTVTRNYPIRYRVVEGAGLHPSHDPMNFEPTEGYPEGVQERDYQRDKDAQLAVIQHTQGYDPDFTLSDNPGPENGPPMVMSDGTVLGGNSRAMSTMRLYREGGGEAYKNALLARASQLGLKPEEIQGMKEPVLVREFLAVPTDVQSLRALGSDLNKGFTRKLSEFEQAVSAGKRVSPETLDYILQQLQDLGEGASLRDLLRERSKGILEKLEADGVIAPTERRGFIDEKTDTLNEAGKDFVENAILGSVVDDPLVLANAPRGVLRKIERSLSSIAKIKGRGGAWDITDYLKEALREHIAAASKGASIKDHIDPPTALMFPREPIHPIVEGIALKLEEDSAAVKKAFSQYSEDADLDVKGQGTMAFYEPPTPWKSFSNNFGIDVKPQEWGTVKATPTLETKATGEQPLTAPLSPVASLTPPPSIGEIFDEEVERMKAEDPPVPFDLGEVELPPREGSSSERFRVDAEKAFPKIDRIRWTR